MYAVHMKKAWLAILAFLATGICMGQLPNLLGQWTGPTTGYVEGNGSYNLVENESINLSVFEQNGRLFKGNITYKRDGKQTTESIAGAIGLDNATLYIAENSGYAFGKIISLNEIEMIYLEDGEGKTVAIDKLSRIDPFPVSQNLTDQNLAIEDMAMEPEDIMMPPALSEG